MQRYHPDRNPGNAAAAESALRINKAYSVLSDPEARASYDSMLAEGRAQQFATNTRPAESPARKSDHSPVKESLNSNWPSLRYTVNAIAAVLGLSLVFLLVIGVIGSSISKNGKDEARIQDADSEAAMRKGSVDMRPGRAFKDCVDCPEMVEIPAGSFQMGTNDPEKSYCGPMHTVRIAKPFALAKTEVTQGQWRAVMGNNQSVFSSCGDDCPAENVSWNEAQTFVEKLSQMTGQTYRLPSEAEWEYACRAGGWYAYCGSDIVDDVAWYGKNSDRTTHPVGKKQPNALGLFDMSGNVMEWTGDCWNSSYKGAPTDGSARTSGDCSKRSQRGGAFGYPPDGVTPSIRTYYSTSNRHMSFGFRPARVLP